MIFLSSYEMLATTFKSILMIWWSWSGASTSQLSEISCYVPWTWSGVGLSISINPGKTILVPFARKRKFKLDSWP